MISMKLMIVGFLLVLLISQGEALQCHCQQITCTGPVETCTYGAEPVCAKILVSGSNARELKGCMTSFEDCMFMNRPGYYAKCCDTDLCNK